MTTTIVPAGTAPQVAKVTPEQLKKAYRDAEKRATVSAGGLAFMAQDRLTLNAMRVSLGFDFTQAAAAVADKPEEFARHWQRFQHWAKQIKKGEIRVAPEAAEMADRTHKKPTRNGKNKKEATARSPSPKLAPEQQKQLKDVALATAETKAEAEYHLSTVFSTREEASKALENVVFGMVKLGMDDLDAIVPAIQANILKAKQQIEWESTAQAVLAVLIKRVVENAGAILEIARTMVPNQ